MLRDDGKLTGKITVSTFYQTDRIVAALDRFQIELPSWGFANTGTRFGKFLQPAAASTVEEKFSDAAQVHRWTGVCPTVALHVLWDFPYGVARCSGSKEARGHAMAYERELSIRMFSRTRFTSTVLWAIPIPRSGRAALDHILESIEIAPAAGQPRHIAVVCGWLELSRHAEHPAPAAMVRGGLEGRASRDDAPISACWWSTNRSSRLSITPISPIGAWRCCSRNGWP